ncbi:MAG: palindromic element RPE4 domain-containing protein [Gammaproteobacteria bacterium]|nr:palindromic element RPE4 domain-containing protein [Gammaproteobacteria bacterium]
MSYRGLTAVSESKLVWMDPAVKPRDDRVEGCDDGILKICCLSCEGRNP